MRASAAGSLGVLPRLLQTAKTAFAAGFSWWLAVRLFGPREPYFAPLAAVLTVQVTVAESISRGAQRLLGVVGGIALSLVVVHLLPVGPLAVATIVLLGMGAAHLAGFGPQAISQVAVSALLVMALRGRPDYAAMRLVETLLGALVAVAVNAAVIPPNAVRPARRRVADLVRELARDLRRMAREMAVPDGARVRRVEGRARRATQLLAESLLFNPLSGRRQEAQHLLAGTRRLTRVASQVRGIARTLDGAPWQRRRALGPALLAAARAVERFGCWLERGDAALPPLERAIRRLRAQNTRMMDRLDEGQRHVVRAASVLADLVKLAEDIRAQGGDDA